MLNRILREIKERVLKDYQKVGSSIEIKLVFHDGKLQKYYLSITEKSTIAHDVSTS
jgi:hypothetical protein